MKTMNRKCIRSNNFYSNNELMNECMNEWKCAFMYELDKNKKKTKCRKHVYQITSYFSKMV